MNPISTLKIQIGGREFQVGCAPDEHDILQQAADMLNAEIASMQDDADKMSVSLETSAVMSALNFAAELLRRQSDAQFENMTRNEIDNRRIAQLVNKIESALAD